MTDESDAKPAAQVELDAQVKPGAQVKPAAKHKKSNALLNVMIAISAIAMIGALGLIAYPTFSDWWNRMHQSYAVAGYVEQTKDMSGAERKAMLKAAHEYNERLAANGDRWHMTDAQKREYDETLDVTGTGIMGYVTIPRIKVKLPVYHGTSDGYAVGDVYWEVTKTRDETHDGMREIEFDAYCYVPDESVPAFTTEFISVTSSELYDYYTGMWFTASTAYNNTERGDNHYIHTVSWNGETYEIEFFYSTSWEKTGDWNNVLTKSYVVYLPEGYDGLVFAAEPQPDNYRDSGKRDQLDSICPEADILNCTTVDAHNCLFFRIG